MAKRCRPRPFLVLTAGTHSSRFCLSPSQWSRLADWWLVPFFLAFIGGLIAYFVLKDRNQKTAEHTLIFGVVWTFVGPILVGGLLFGLFGTFTTTTVHYTTSVFP